MEGEDGPKGKKVRKTGRDPGHCVIDIRLHGNWGYDNAKTCGAFE